MARRFRWLVSQLGVRPSAHLPDAEVVLIGLADLAAGWRIIDQRRWRTGQQSDQAWAARARTLGSVTAWRSFANPAQDRWLWAQATPLATVEDAQQALHQAWAYRLANLRAQAKVIASEDGPPLTIPADQVLTRQERTTGPWGDGAARYLAWAYRGMLSILAGSSQGEPWAWQDLAALASVQSHRIDTITSHNH
jgi:hypothetical protein